MTTRFLPVAFAVAVGSTAVFTNDTSAGCNAIPDASSTALGGVVTTPANVPASPGLIGFKGALGRIDRLHFVPTTNKSFRIQADGICVNGARDAQVIVRPVSPEVNVDELVVSFLVKRPDSDVVDAQILGTQEFCKEMFPPSSSGAGGDHGLAVRCLEAEAPPLTVEPDGEHLNIRVTLPGDGTLLSPRAHKAPVSGTATVVLTRKPESAARHTALLGRIDAEGCANTCAELLRDGALGCVDTFYSIESNGTAKSDPIPCVIGTTQVSKQDFKEQCEDELPADPNLAACGKAPTTLSFWQDPCGGIHIPFDWTKIRQDTNGNSISRIVKGYSGTSNAEKGKGTRILIPGREFMGTTPYDPSPQGTGVLGTIDWRFPDIDVWYPGSQATGLTGTTDQDDSIIHVYPRMRASVVCDVTTGDEACMAVEGRHKGSGLNCACEDRYAATCMCKDLEPARYFACKGSPETDGMPCTRHRHCNTEDGNTAGKCSGKPTCQLKTRHGVWAKGSTHTAVTTCWTDDDCKPVRLCSDNPAQSCVADSDCGANATCNETWCGYHLFNFDDRKQNNIITLDAKIEDPAPRKDRGVCEKDNNNFCSNLPGNLKACSSADGACRGYRLRAGGKP